MQHIVIEKPYKFIPPHRGNWWASFIQRFKLIDRWMKKSHGIVEYECRHIDRLKQSLADGHGVMLTPNHAKPSDPIVMGIPARRAGTHVFAMASWHLFNQDWFTGYAIHKMGGFSVNREGVDRKAIDTAIEILAGAERPLILFPEGATTRTNDRLQNLLDGVAFIARTAAKKRAKRIEGGKVVVHPVAIKYLFQDDLKAAVDPILTEFEERLTWQSHSHLPLVDRITKLGKTLLSLKEIEYLGSQQTGRLTERCHTLIERLLCPLEEEWMGGKKDDGVVPRVKALRLQLVPGLVRNEVSDEERDRRWRQLGDIYLAQQISCYPPDYIGPLPSVDRLLETVERFEEDLTDRVRVFGKQKVVVEIGERIEVSPKRDRDAEVDPLMLGIKQQLQAMLDQLALESPLYEEG